MDFVVLIGIIEGAVGVGAVYSMITDKPSATKSALFTNMHRKATSLAVVRAPDGSAENKDPAKLRSTMVDSPVLVLLRQMVLTAAPWPYVLFTPPSMGKTAAARTFMHISIPNLFPNAATRPKALMVTGSMGSEDASYFDHISETFDAGATPWFAPLIAALSRTPTEMEIGKKPSILILDDFDALGRNYVNINNMKKLCHDLATLRDVVGMQHEIHVVIMTQSEVVANKLCKINNWKKISPMPRAYIPPVGDFSKIPLPNPDWTGVPWTGEIIERMVRKRFAPNELQGVVWVDLCQDGANPGSVLKAVKERTFLGAHQTLALGATDELA
eukprot:scaffold191920_cov49-Attheya_sp.AAC.2